MTGWKRCLPNDVLFGSKLNGKPGTCRHAATIWSAKLCPVLSDSSFQCQRRNEQDYNCVINRRHCSLQSEVRFEHRISAVENQQHGPLILVDERRKVSSVL